MVKGRGQKHGLRRWARLTHMQVRPCAAVISARTRLPALELQLCTSSWMTLGKVLQYSLPNFLAEVKWVVTQPTAGLLWDKLPWNV